MRNMAGGKGSAQRPSSVDNKTFGDRWEMAFGKKEEPAETQNSSISGGPTYLMKLDSVFVLEIGVPNKNKRVYGLQAVDKMITDFNKRAHPRDGLRHNVYGCLHNDLKIEPDTSRPPLGEVLHKKPIDAVDIGGRISMMSYLSIDIMDYTHEICQLYVKDGNLRADIVILNTPKGQILRDLYLEGNIDFRVACYGNMEAHGLHVHITNPTFFTLFATPNGA